MCYLGQRLPATQTKNIRYHVRSSVFEWEKQNKKKDVSIIRTLEIWFILEGDFITRTIKNKNDKAKSLPRFRTARGLVKLLE